MRYRVFYSDITKLARYYTKTYRKRAKVTKLFALSHVVAYHVRSLRSSTSWSGINLVRYKRTKQTHIYFLCRLRKSSYNNMFK